MKPKLLYFSTAVLTGILGLKLCTALAQSTSVDDRPKSGNPSASSVATNQADMKNKTSSSENQFKIITDESTGRYALVDTNKCVVMLNDRNGTALWSTNIVEGLKKLTNVPQLQGRTIRGLRVHEGDLWVDMGRGYAIVDLRTGQLKGTSTR